MPARRRVRALRVAADTATSSRATPCVRHRPVLLDPDGAADPSDRTEAGASDAAHRRADRRRHRLDGAREPVVAAGELRHPRSTSSVAQIVARFSPRVIGLGKRAIYDRSSAPSPMPMSWCNRSWPPTRQTATLRRASPLPREARQPISVLRLASRGMDRVCRTRQHELAERLDRFDRGGEGCARPTGAERHAWSGRIASYFRMVLIASSGVPTAIAPISIALFTCSRGIGGTSRRRLVDPGGLRKLSRYLATSDVS